MCLSNPARHLPRTPAYGLPLRVGKKSEFDLPAQLQTQFKIAYFPIEGREKAKPGDGTPPPGLIMTGREILQNSFFRGKGAEGTRGFLVPGGLGIHLPPRRNFTGWVGAMALGSLWAKFPLQAGGRALHGAPPRRSFPPRQG